jgi:hypothetical protein
MQVKTGERVYLDEQATAEPAEDLVMRDYYTRLPQIRLTGLSTSHSTQSETATEIMLDGNDVAKLVECAVRHPSIYMRYAVLVAIWNHPDSFRQIFRFGLEASPAFSEVHEIVAEELGRHSAASWSHASNATKPAGDTLLPRMPLPPHLRDRERR